MKTKEPICIIKDKKELIELLKEWQHRLFLDDWIIKVAIVDKEELDEDLAGHNSFIFTNKSAMIKLAKIEEEDNDRIAKCCMEYTLVHELLHCKMNLFSNLNSDYESAYLEAHEHQLLDEMAKSLIMAKYNIDLNWFKNF